MKPSYIGAILLGVSSLMSFALFAGDPAAGKTKSAICAGCHGADGNSPAGTWPSLAGQHAKYLVKQLNDFKSGDRVDPVMKGMSSTLSDSDREDLAAYYASQKAKPVSFDDELVSLGQDIYRGGITATSIAACMSCHSPSGGGIAPAGYPSLKGQHPQYLETQLKKFQSEARANDAGKMMRNIAKRMTEKEIKAVAAYLAGIQ